MIAVIGAGAMGSALAMVHARAGLKVALLGTVYDDATVDAVRSGKPHPALGIALDAGIDARPHHQWGAVLPNTERVVLAVSSDGMGDMAAEVASHASDRAVWAVATKGWDPETLRTPSEVIGSHLGGIERIVIMAGPALAPELVAGAPAAMICAGVDGDAARGVASTLIAAGVSAATTDDVLGAEIAAAYKNVTAIAVGMCEGLAERKAEQVFIHRFANARAAMFALGLRDMAALAVARGGRADTILGLAGAGDLYVTCLGGRNGSFGRLLGSGQTAEQAVATIGSTVEGVANTEAALTVAKNNGVELHAAECVRSVLAGEASPEDAIAAALTALSS